MAVSFRIRSLEFSIGKLPEVGFVGVVVIRLQVTERRRHRVRAVIGDGYGLRVTQFRKGFHVKAKIGVGVVAFGLSFSTAARPGRSDLVPLPPATEHGLRFHDGVRVRLDVTVTIHAP